MLIAMATARMSRGTRAGATGSDGWAAAFAEAGLPQPDRDPLEFAGRRMAFVWRSEMVAATLGAVPDEVATKAAGDGWELVCLPDDGACVVPDELMRLLGETA
jgi:hypothetical protein